MTITPNNWKMFFTRGSEGLGTLYERLVLHHYFRNIIIKFKIKNVLECPCFGMTGYTGINSWYFAKHGIDVYICDIDEERIKWIKRIWEMVNLNAKFIKINDYSKLPFEAEIFDLVWNFAALWYIKLEKIPQILSELARVARKVIFVVLPNNSNIFYPLRRSLEKDFLKYVDENVIKKADIILDRVFRKHKFKLYEKGFLDCPPWPDIALSKEDIFGRKKIKDNTLHCNINNIKIPEYYNYLIDSSLEDKIVRKFGFIEKLPDKGIKRVLAHHKYWIYVKER